MKTYLFNPEHDMALASFSPYYKAPAEIVRMKNDLAALPVWYADPESRVRLDSVETINFFVEQCCFNALAPSVELVTDWEVDELSPWGWDPAIIHFIQQTSGELPSLPSQQDVLHIKRLSGRQCCVTILDDFRGLAGVCGKSTACCSMQEVKKNLEQETEVILKAPWSGSGRGLNRTSLATWNSNIEGWTARVLRTQGAVMVEPLYNKVVDFAMEFHSSQLKQLSFVGYSLFETDDHGNYKQNILLTDQRIVELLTKYVPAASLQKVKEQLLESLSSLLVKDYDGYLGVDMMICENGGVYYIHPCVEINLRMNMGILSRILYDRYIVPGVSGRYIVEHYNKDDEALQQYSQLRQAYPAEIRNKKMYSGYFPLTPVFSTTRYHCYVLLDAYDGI